MKKILYSSITFFMLVNSSCSNQATDIQPVQKSYCFSKSNFNIKTSPYLPLVIKGNIKDKVTLELIKDAKITFMEQTFKSDINGEYYMSLVSYENCTYQIKVSKDGYKDLIQEVKVENPNPNYQKIIDLNLLIEKNN